jgi:hypothetical protein
MPEAQPAEHGLSNQHPAGYAGDRLSWILCRLVTVRGASPWYKVVSGGVNVADDKTGVTKQDKPANGADRGHSHLVAMGNSKAEGRRRRLEDRWLRAKGVRTNLLRFNTAYYANAGCVRSPARDQTLDANTAAIKAFDGDERTAWHDKSSGKRVGSSASMSTAENTWQDPKNARVQGSIVRRAVLNCRSNDGGTTRVTVDSH